MQDFWVVYKKKWKKVKLVFDKGAAYPYNTTPEPDGSVFSK